MLQMCFLRCGRSAVRGWGFLALVLLAGMPGCHAAGLAEGPMGLDGSEEDRTSDSGTEGDSDAGTLADDPMDAGDAAADSDCEPESDAEFCSRLGKECELVSGEDNCSRNRVVASCGDCTGPQTCGGGGTPGVCGGGTTPGATPYGGSPIPLPGTIMAACFDDGGEGIAYHDATAGNDGDEAFRNPTDVDIKSNTGTPAVGWLPAGEWLVYTVDVQAADTYTIKIHASSGDTDGGSFRLDFAGVDATGVVTVPATGSYDTWTIVQRNVTLSAGVQQMRLEILDGWFDFDSIEVVGASAWCGDGTCNDTETCSSCSADCCGPSGRPIPATLFGHHNHFSVAWPITSFGFIRSWDHTYPGRINWPDVETARGVYNWTHLDEFVDRAVSSGVEVLYELGPTPTWAVSGTCTARNGGCKEPPDDIQDWKDFLTALGGRYQGKIQSVEVWNEASWSGYWVGTMAQLVALEQAAAPIVHGFGMKLLTPSATGGAATIANFFNRYFTAGGGVAADVVAFHSYPRVCCTADSYPRAEEVVDIISQLKAKMEEFHLETKAVWSTEGGWGKNTTTPDDNSRVAFLARHFLLQWSGGVERHAWYSYESHGYTAGDDLSTGWGTLWTRINGLAPAGIAYDELYKWMVGATMTAPCTQSGTVWSCTLTRASGYEAKAVWNTDGESTFSAAAPYTQYRTLSGGKSAIGGGAVTIGPAPILLESGDAW